MVSVLDDQPVISSWQARG